MAKSVTPADAIDRITFRAFFTQLLVARGWRPPEFNRAMGWDPGNTRIYQWRNGKGQPGAKTILEIERRLGVRVGDPNSIGGGGGGTLVTTAPLPAAVAVARSVKPIIHHIINSDGSALIKFEAVVPARASFRIMSILNDAGLIPDGDGDGKESGE